ncbi:hypothetical protein JZ751_010792, partial [Albula glossodonta]
MACSTMAMIGEGRGPSLDQIYHLASPASPPNYMYNPIKTLKTNTIGTLNMLGPLSASPPAQLLLPRTWPALVPLKGLAKRVGARLLLASTSEVYGDPEVHPQNEEYWGHVNPIGPRACYDEGKRVAETMCYAYMKQVSVARVDRSPPRPPSPISNESICAKRHIG